MVTWRTGISCQLLGASAATTHQLLSSAFWNDSDFHWFLWKCSRNIWDSFSHRQPWINLLQRDSHRERPGFHERWLTDKPFWSRTWNWQGTKQACWGWNSSCLSKRKKDEKWKLYFTTFWHILTGHVWGLWSWSMGEYSLVFENRRRGRPPALICHPSPVSQVGTVSWWGHCDTICNFPLQTSWVYIFLSNWWWDNDNGDDNINDTTILHSFKSTRSETFWLHDFWSIHPLEFSGLENDWSDGLALVPLFIVGIWSRFYWWSEIKHSRVHI